MQKIGRLGSDCSTLADFKHCLTDLYLSKLQLHFANVSLELALSGSGGALTTFAYQVNGSHF